MECGPDSAVTSGGKFCSNLLSLFVMQRGKYFYGNLESVDESRNAELTDAAPGAKTNAAQ